MRSPVLPISVHPHRYAKPLLQHDCSVPRRPSLIDNMLGLLEALPPRINDRAPMFRGRSELGMWSLSFPLLQHIRNTVAGVEASHCA